jgi:hypothetical protein
VPTQKGRFEREISIGAGAAAGRFCAGWLKLRENCLRDFTGGGVTLLSERNIKTFIEHEKNYPAHCRRHRRGNSHR